MKIAAGKHGKPKLRRYKKPKELPPQKPSRPKRGDLKKIYKDYISTSVEQRINVLAKAMTWYDHALVYLTYKQGGKLTTNQLRAKNKAEANRSCGIGIKGTDKEKYFATAIQAFETFAESYKPPKLSVVIKKFNSQKRKLTQSKSKMQDKYGEFVSTIHHAMNPVAWDTQKPISILVDKISTKSHYSSSGTVTLNKKYVIELKKLARAKGWLSVVIQLIDVLSDACSLFQVVDTKGVMLGRNEVNKTWKIKCMVTMLENFNAYAQKSYGPRTIVRRAKPSKPTPSS